jgi:hydrogenase-4 component B
MILAAVLVAVAVLGSSALAAALAMRRDLTALRLGTIGAVIACALGGAAGLVALLSGRVEALRTSFATPLGPLHAGIDRLSAFFLVCVFLVSGLSAVYGAGYLRAFVGRRRLAPAVAFFNLLVAAMAVVVLARDVVLFLVGWELMALASFFLVTYESDRPEVRRAGVTYLVASQAGVACVFVLFLILGRSSGSFEFASFTQAAAPVGALQAAAFLLAVVGFGSKAGFWPMHVWLPDAHPAAPSHVSAVMSGVMIKTGIYGLVRVLDFLGPPPAWWGALLLGIGAVSGVAGVLHALAQHDLKRLLAYHSVENIGIIALGLGLGLIGRSLGHPEVAVLGFTGGLLHVLNHGLFKGLLFQGAGSVLHATGTRELDTLGGLQRRMPRTALTFLVGAVAICGLPPLNGFVSEWLIYLGAFRAGADLPTAWAIPALAVVVALALIGGLAAACFVKAYGVVFLGEPRSDAAARAHEAPALMTGPMWAGAALCVAIGVAAPATAGLLGPLAASLAGVSATPALGPLVGVTLTAGAVIALVVILAVVRAGLLRGREVGAAGTWGCGYARPRPTMQYTAASFASPVLTPFDVVFHHEAHTQEPDGFFPRGATWEEHRVDRAESVIVRAVRGFVAGLRRLGFLQHGRVQLYLIYVLATLVALLLWRAVAGA